MPGRGRGGSHRGGRGGRGGRSTRGRGGRSGTRLGRAAKPDGDNNLLMDKDEADASLDIEKDVKQFFIGVASFEQHREAQEKSAARYASAVALLTKNGVEVSQNAKVRALAAAWSRKDQAMARAFLSLRTTFGLVEVLKAVTILDSARQVRQLEKKLQRMELTAEKSGGKLRKKTQTKYKVQIDNLTVMKTSAGSVSGALSLQIRKWVGTFTKEELEFFALQMPTEPWRKLADIVHFHPDDFKALPWFLGHCYGAAPPEGTLINRAKGITAENVNSLVTEMALPFAFVREQKDNLTPEAKAAIVRAEDKVDRGIWWYEELACPEVDQVISERLAAGEQISLNYGKLMERLVTLKKRKEVPRFFETLVSQAEAKLEGFRLCLQAPIAVLADASSSMNVAIETATIVSSLLTAFCEAELVFFNDEAWRPSASPRTIREVIDLALKTKATRSTAPAAALWPFYETKQVIKTFIVVTDEEENTKSHDYNFDDLMLKYREEVYPANIVFFSFLRNQTCKGDMVPQLKNMGIPVRQFILNRERPDLTKLDNILGQLAAQTDDFEQLLKEIQAKMENDGMEKTFEEIFKQTGETVA